MKEFKRAIDFKEQIKSISMPCYTFYSARYTGKVVFDGVELGFRMETGDLHRDYEGLLPTNELSVDANFPDGVHPILEMIELEDYNLDDVMSLSKRYAIELNVKTLELIRSEYLKLKNEIKADWKHQLEKLRLDDSEIEEKPLY
ncbi:hypothetical protein OLH55_004655 [Vibrio parahaemolyticus]|uniref:hypothetical protein n=1 Tax=Vibrio antiquarius (strain Ex25) TaxID=150340 RepID=UPI00265B6A61|nr:hypothetical protein [Vibrio antiquarius]EKA4077439.1 hypothetical protein [Vibrio parahaemolyticus]MCE9842635.1 hypothetical protein [Vibrio antiquarius]